MNIMSLRNIIPGAFCAILLCFTATAAEKIDAAPVHTVAWKRGCDTARQDIARGVLRVRSFGIFHPADRIFCKMLLDEYNVRSESAGCVVTKDLIEEINGYNSVSKPEIARRFGKDVLDDTWKRACAQQKRGRPGRHGP
jgi:hypothetical protein